MRNEMNEMRERGIVKNIYINEARAS